MTHERISQVDKTTINGAPVSNLQEKFTKDDLISFMKVTKLIELAPILSDQQFTMFLNALMHYSIKVVGWAESAAESKTLPRESEGGYCQARANGEGCNCASACARWVAASGVVKGD